MTELVMLLATMGLLLCLVDLRLGMYAAVNAGFLQDVARKLVPGEPVYLTSTVIVLAAAAFASAAMRGAIPSFRRIPDWEGTMKWPIEVFAVLVIAQCVATFVYTSSVMLAGIGFIAYLAPFPAFLMAYAYASSFERVLVLLKLYLLLCTFVTAGVYLSWLGIESSLLRSVGEPLVVFSLETGQPLELPAGFMRSPEIAAWHAASGFCVAVILGTVLRRPGWLWLSATLCVYFLAAIFLSGRRKFLLEMMVFLPLLLGMLVHFRIGSQRLLRVFGLLAIAGVSTAFFGLFTDDTVSRLSEASLRQEDSVFEATVERFYNLTFGAFEYVVAANGIFGAGAGSGSQGSQHFGGGMESVGLAAEGGLGKILAELGVPGLAAALWLAWALLAYLWRSLALARNLGFDRAVLVTGLAAFLGANGIVFIGAHQAFGDLFVLLLIGWFIGFIIASRRWAVPAPARRP